MTKVVLCDINFLPSHPRVPGVNDYGQSCILLQLSCRSSHSSWCPTAMVAPKATVACYNFNCLLSLPTVPGATQPWKLPWPQSHIMTSIIFSPFPQSPTSHYRGSFRGQSRLLCDSSRLFLSSRSSRQHNRDRSLEQSRILQLQFSFLFSQLLQFPVSYSRGDSHGQSRIPKLQMYFLPLTFPGATQSWQLPWPELHTMTSIFSFFSPHSSQYLTAVAAPMDKAASYVERTTKYATPRWCQKLTINGISWRRTSAKNW